MEIDAATPAEALAEACWVAACRCVMVVWQGSVADVEFVPQAWIRNHPVSVASRS